MLSPASLHLRDRHSLRQGALAASLMTGALLLAGCDRQPTPETASVNSAVTGTSSAPDTSTPSALPRSGTDSTTNVADAGPATGGGPGVGTGITPSKDPMGVPGSAGTTASSAPHASGNLDNMPSTSAGKQVSQNAGALDAADRAFVEKAAADGLFEVQAGKLAAAQGKNAAVKAFGSMLSSDHASAGAQLKALAASKGLTLPDALPADKQTTLDALGRAPASDFDHEFVRTVGIRAHQDAIATFEKASQEAKDPEIKAFAAKTLPTLKAHLEAARQLPGAKS